MTHELHIFDRAWNDDIHKALAAKGLSWILDLKHSYDRSNKAGMEASKRKARATTEATHGGTPI